MITAFMYRGITSELFHGTPSHLNVDNGSKREVIYGAIFAREEALVREEALERNVPIPIHPIHVW